MFGEDMDKSQLAPFTAHGVEIPYSIHSRVWAKRPAARCIVGIFSSVSRLRTFMYIVFSHFQYTTGSHYSRSTSHITVLRGSCLLYYRTCHCVCHFRSGLAATLIKEYCIVLYSRCF